MRALRTLMATALVICLAGAAVVWAGQGAISFLPYEERAYRLVNSVAFSPDDQVVYLNLFLREVLEMRGTPDPEVAEVALFTARRTADGWSEPELLPFSRDFISYEATLSGDGSLMVFNSQRPYPDGRTPERNDLWMVERDGDRWGEPQRIEAITTFDNEESYGTLTADRTLVFLKAVPGADGEPVHDLYESRFVDGAFQPATRHPVSSERWGEGDPWIAPDGSYLIFTRWDDEIGWAETVDLYVAFQRDGTWSDPVALDNINTEGADFGPAVSADGRWLYSKHDSSFLRRPVVEVLAPYR